MRQLSPAKGQYWKQIIRNAFDAIDAAPDFIEAVQLYFPFILWYKYRGVRRWEIAETLKQKRKDRTSFSDPS